MREQIRHRTERVIESTGARIRGLLSTQRRAVSVALGLTIIALLALLAARPWISRASDGNLLSNGGFEHGFASVSGCGDVGAQWQCFTNGGAVNYGFYDEQWDPVVPEGRHSQLIEINTKGLAAGDNDRYAGISQTVRVVKGAKYKFSLRGVIRTSNLEGDPWRYSVQVGYLDGPNADWRDVENWTDVGWNTYFEREKPGGVSGFMTNLVPDSDLITVFVRVWKKWGVAGEELDVDLDAIELIGPSVPMPKSDGMTPEGSMPMTGIGGPVSAGWGNPWQAADNEPVVCNGDDLVYNGSFEQGFNRIAWGDVGRGWAAFTNGGAVNYGFYQEQWDVVVADGHNGQLIEISSEAVYPTDADRYAGIYQRIDGLQPGRTYELTLRGLLRGEGNEEDPDRFAVQAALAAQSDWRHVDDDDWEWLDVGPTYARTQPGPMAQVKVRFEAPAQTAFLYIRGWKKWAITNVEMDLNLDAITLRACNSAGGGQAMGGGQPMGVGGPTWATGPEGDACVYVVKPGDTLGYIAAKYGVSSHELVRANGIDDPDFIYVGQKFDIPGCGQQNMEMQPDGPMTGPAMADGPTYEPQDRPQTAMREMSYTVQNGDMLSYIAEQYGVNVYTMASYNGIDNMNFIYAGQVLRIPSNMN